MTWFLIALAVVAVVAIGLVIADRLRSAQLRERFGPEYERTLERHGNRRAAESDLRQRLKRHRKVDLRELTPESRDRYTTRWRTIQAAFVDDPRGSVDEAAALVDRVMDERGYLATDDGAADDGAAADGDGDGHVDRYELVAVDHPTLVEELRAAQAGDGRSRANASVDALRNAFLHHRELFDALVRGTDTDTGVTDDTGTAGGPARVGHVEEVRS
jgi:hypothetical protein